MRCILSWGPVLNHLFHFFGAATVYQCRRFGCSFQVQGVACKFTTKNRYIPPWSFSEYDCAWNVWHNVQGSGLLNVAWRQRRMRMFRNTPGEFEGPSVFNCRARERAVSIGFFKILRRGLRGWWSNSPATFASRANISSAGTDDNLMHFDGATASIVCNNSLLLFDGDQCLFELLPSSWNKVLNDKNKKHFAD